MLNWIRNISNKTKFKQSLNRVIELSYKYRNLISKDCLMKISDNIYWFVNRDHSITSICMKKPNWRLYVGCDRNCIEDYSGNYLKLLERNSRLHNNTLLKRRLLKNEKGII